MNEETFPKPDPVKEARRMFSRAKAREFLKGLPKVDPEDRELWLALKISEALAQYEGGLERMVNAYSNIAFDAVSLSMPKPILVMEKK